MALSERRFLEHFDEMFPIESTFTAIETYIDSNLVAHRMDRRIYSIANYWPHFKIRVGQMLRKPVINFIHFSNT